MGKFVFLTSSFTTTTVVTDDPSVRRSQLLRSLMIAHERTKCFAESYHPCGKWRLGKSVNPETNTIGSSVVRSSFYT